jgi:type VI secretion system secreted protein Hcp
MTFKPVPAAASVDLGYHVYLQLEGITGESTQKGYEKWINLSSVQFKMSGKTTGFVPPTGGGGGAEKISFNSFEIAKLFDSSSIPLMINELQGKHYPKGKIVFTRTTGKGALTPVLMFEIQEVLVSSYSFADTEEPIDLELG